MKTRQTIQNKLDMLQVKARMYNKTSQRYHYVDSEQIIRNILKLDSNIYLEDVLTTTGKTTTHILDFRLKDTVQAFGNKMQPRLLISNSYNGESSLKIKIGFYRFVCANGLVVGNNIYSERIVHLKSDTIEGKIKELLIVAQQTLLNMPTILTEMESKLTVQINNTIAQNIINQLNLSKRVKDKSIDTLLNPYTRIEDRTGDLWGLYNIVNETIRNSSRSALRDTEKNYKLMDDIINLAA